MIDGPAGSTLVFGPAYLDRVIRVDGPLAGPGSGPDRSPMDLSVDGRWVRTGPKEWARLAGVILLIDPAGASLRVRPPEGWVGRRGTVMLGRPLPGPIRSKRFRVGVAASDSLGGMGAGFAAALGGTLVSVLGGPDDPTSRAVAALLTRAGVPHEPARVADQPADWTLLISSGAHGDKLAVGFRGCHAAWAHPEPWRDRACRVRVVAALPNRVVPAALGDRRAGRVRAFFPSARNMLDRADPVADFAGQIDLLSCNRGEWLDLGAGTAGLARVPVVAVTDGPRGATVRFRAEADADVVAELTVPAFPRAVPIVDTNRAGEAFAASLLATLVNAGWAGGPVAADLVRRGALRGSAASALVLGRADFGFPTLAEVDRAVERGRVG